MSKLRFSIIVLTTIFLGSSHFLFAEEGEKISPPSASSPNGSVGMASWVQYLTAGQEERTHRNRSFLNEVHPTWEATQKRNLLQNFLKNSDGTYSGAVIASPSTGKPSTPEEPGEPNYHFHWVRDASIAIELVADLAEDSHSSDEERKEYLEILKAYSNFSSKLQNLPTPYDLRRAGDLGTGDPNRPDELIAVRAGEPKYELVKVFSEPHNPDGPANYTWEPAPYTGDWGRPQNDSAGLRAGVMNRVVKVLEKNLADKKERHQSVDNEERELAQAKRVLVNDLSYVAHRWNDLTFDLWEEIAGRHFFTISSCEEGMREGLPVMEKMASEWEKMGAEQRNRLSQSERETYETAANNIKKARESLGQMEQALESFAPKGLGYIQASRDIVVPGMKKVTDLDSAVLIAAVRRKKGNFSVSDPRVMATAAKLIRIFQAGYAVNKVKGFPGVAIGRYFPDMWDGVQRRADQNGNPMPEGHPWVLTTAVMGQVFLGVAREMGEDGVISITPENADFFRYAMHEALPHKWEGELKKGKSIEIRPGDKKYHELLHTLNDRGNDFLLRVHMSGVGMDQRLSEQFSRKTIVLNGNQPLMAEGLSAPVRRAVKRGAENLGWSCVEALRALRFGRHLKSEIASVVEGH